ncbi:MAG: OPT/YSL family transporter, partial [Calditrichia bacterium]|nr:OPT/YSL family transporter [Calditrichia bacterium]
MNTHQEKSGFTIRAAFIAIALSIFLLMSTSYIALKLGAAPWPIIFSVIVSSSVLKLLNRRRELNIHEANVAQAGGSIGGLVAVGIAFTLPGILYLNQTKGIHIELPEPWVLGLVFAVAGILGLILSIPLKYTFIDEENLPFPAGTAGAELLKLGKTGGKELFLLLIIGSLAGIFTLIRDIYFPAGLVLLTISSLSIVLIFLPLPIAIGAGYILGPRAGFSWLAGAVIGWFVLVPLMYLNGLETTLAVDYTKSLGMGMVLGSGMSFFLSYVLPRFRQIFLPALQTAKRIRLMIPVALAVGLLTLLLSGVHWISAILTLLGVWAMVAVAARMTGETNIDPLEQFGIFITLLIAGFYGLMSIHIPLSTLFIIVAFVSIACAIAGDAGHDYKSAAIIGTRFFDIVKVDFITVTVVGFISPFLFEIIRQGFSNQLFTPAMPAPQARLVAESIIGFEHPESFIIGFSIAFLGELPNYLLPEKLKNRFLWMPFGIGLFLGPGLAIPIALGAVLNIWINKKRPNLFHTGILIAAGIMGAEGIAGFSAGALTIFGMDFRTTSFILIILFIMIFLVGLWRFAQNCKHS